MPRKNRQLRPKNATPKPDCKRPATKGADRFRKPRRPLSSTTSSGFIWGIPVFNNLWGWNQADRKCYYTSRFPGSKRPTSMGVVAMRPASIYLNQHLTDLQRRRRLFAGDIFIFSNLRACSDICQHAMDTLCDVFETDSPETAYLNLPVQEFVRRTEAVKNRFTNGLRSKELLREYAIETGSNPQDYYFLA